MSCNVTSYICQKVIIIEYWIRQSSRKERTIEGHVRYKVGLYRENGTRYTGWAKLSDTTLHFCL